MTTHDASAASGAVGPAEATSQQPRPSAGAEAARRAYAAEASGDLVAMSFPGARRVAGWLFWLVFPLVCLVSLYLSISAIAHHIGSQPSGIRGTYVAESSCSRGICLVGGTFVSDDGKVKVTSLLGDPRWTNGTSHKVVYDGTSAEVVGLGSWDPTPSVIAGVGATAYLILVGYLYLGLRRQRDPA